MSVGLLVPAFRVFKIGLGCIDLDTNIILPIILSTTSFSRTLAIPPLLIVMQLVQPFLLPYQTQVSAVEDPNI